MSVTGIDPAGDEISGASALLQQLRATLRAGVVTRILRILRLYRAEVRRTSAAFALALTAGFLACAALSLAALTVLLAFWETHRVLAAFATSLAFALLAVLAVLALRSATRTPRA
ncbi:MAG TPA: hypothetical protein VEU54_03605 [Steroidobacteraceae bacterium]|nr:hypothetical protein [Steroidobacteraceae bacterium]